MITYKEFCEYDNETSVAQRAGALQLGRRQTPEQGRELALIIHGYSRELMRAEFDELYKLETQFPSERNQRRAFIGSVCRRFRSSPWLRALVDIREEGFDLPPDFARKLLRTWLANRGVDAKGINPDVLKVTFGDELRGRGERRKGDSLEEMLKLDVVADRFERAYQELSDINAVIDAELKARSKS